MLRVMIAYRPDEHEPLVDRMIDRLVAAFGRTNVMRDIDVDPASPDFRKDIEGRVRTYDVLMVLIGPTWLSRLKEPESAAPVALVEAALKRDKLLVIPVLLEGAPMPAAADLPPALRPLARKNHSMLRTEDFDRDVSQVVDQANRVMTGLISGVRSLQEPEPPPGSLPPYKEAFTLTPAMIAGGLAALAVVIVVILVVTGAI